MQNIIKKIRFGVIGAGHIGKRHGVMVQRNPESSLEAICDIRSASELSLGEKDLGAVPFFQSAEAMLASSIPMDVVSICTPNGLHAEHAILALESNKHVVIEKPMALSKGDCERVIFKALQMDKQVFCVMQNRYSPPSQWIKSVIDEGWLGKIFTVQINCYWNRDDRYYKPGGWKGTQALDGGTLFTQFSHFVDILYWLFGDISNIQARFSDFTHSHSTDFEDTGMVNFDFVQGGMGTLSYSTAVAHQNFESSLTVIAENGTVKIGGQYMNEVEYCDIKGYKMPALAPSSPANDYGSYKGSANNHHYIFQNVVDTLKGRTTITTNALEGMKVVEMIESIYAQKEQAKVISSFSKRN